MSIETGEPIAVPKQTFAWDDQRVDLLCKLYADGLSASHIAEQLGITRNAIIGKAHRLGLTRDLHPSSRNSRAKAEGTHYARAARIAGRRAQVTSTTPARLRPVKHTAGNKTILELGLGDCRWPIGEKLAPAELFCGAKAVFGRPYCGKHCRVGGARYRGR